jgi:DNA-3-methyladenine glycosylase
MNSMLDKLPDFLLEPSYIVAPRLLGCLLVRDVEGATLIGRIVETEAYDQHDAASHSYHGETKRTRVMFGPPGHLYVYFTYGMHYCCNIVTGPTGEGAAVLVRAVEPLEGEKRMRINRHGRSGLLLTNGPAKLCQAFEINASFNGHDLQKSPLQLIMQPALASTEITITTLIGISRSVDRLWRFVITDNAFASRRSNKA